VIEETATVVSCDGVQADVETERRGGCANCSVGQGCGAALLARVFGGRSSRLRVDNAIRAEPGDRVVIGVPESGVVMAATLLYLTPLLGLIVCAFLAELGAGWSGAADTGEWPSILGGALGFVGGLIAARRLDRSAALVSRARPVILRRRLATGL
jgi:sigma-E factor negative regulatory protein RseC